MIRLAANLSLLFTELPFMARFEAAANAGFTAVETQFPYAWPAARQAQALERLQLEQVLINLPAGNWEAGERGIACDPSRVAEFRQGVELALEYARVLNCPRLNCLAGVPPAGVSREVATATFTANLAYAAGRLAQAGRELLIEPINNHDIPGFLLTDMAQAVAIVQEVGAQNLRVQYDLYHRERMGEAISADLPRHRALIGHIQIADVPGRHEPGSGAMDWDALFALIEACGYQGWVSAEYLPAAETAAGLGWIERYGLRRAARE